MIKSRIIYLLLTALVLLLSSCDKESKLSPTEDLGIVDMFSPDENADPRVKTMYNDYGVWVRTYFSSIDELTNAILAQDALVAMRGAENLEEEKVPEVLNYSEALLSNVSEQYSKSFFPLEFFYVKQYGSLYWIYPVKALGRSRLILMWPNTTDGAIPVSGKSLLPGFRVGFGSVAEVGVYDCCPYGGTPERIRGWGKGL